MANEIVKIEDSLKALDVFSNEHQIATLDVKAKFTQAFALASAVNKIKSVLTDDIVAKVFMPLKDCGDLGFRTDEGSRDKPYSISVIKNVMIEAVLRGASPCNNEVNVISSRCYLTKNYFARKVGEYAGLTDLDISLGIPRMLQGGAAVDAKATWKVGGKPMSLERTGANAIPVRVNAGMGADAILGKAERKLLASIYKKLTGSEHSDGEIDDDVLPGELKQATGAVVDDAKPVSQTQSVKEVIRQQAETPKETPKQETPTAATGKKKADAKPAKQEAPPKQEAPKQEAAKPASTPPADPGAEGKSGDSGSPDELPPAPETETFENVMIANARGQKKRGSDEIDNYILVDATNSKFITKNKELAMMGKEAKDKKQSCTIIAYREGDAYIITDLAVNLPPEPESEEQSGDGEGGGVPEDENQPVESAL